MESTAESAEPQSKEAEAAGLSGSAALLFCAGRGGEVVGDIDREREFATRGAAAAAGGRGRVGELVRSGWRLCALIASWHEEVGDSTVEAAAKVA